MTSSPLLARVAESIDIFAPISHVGCLRACSGVISWSSSCFFPRNGPPEQVRIIFSTWGRAVAIVPSVARDSRHWKIAECSESTGMIWTLLDFTACIILGPSATSVSLLARAMFLPDWMAA